MSTPSNQECNPQAWVQNKIEAHETKLEQLEKLIHHTELLRDLHRVDDSSEERGADIYSREIERFQAHQQDIMHTICGLKLLLSSGSELDYKEKAGEIEKRGEHHASIRSSINWFKEKVAESRKRRPSLSMRDIERYQNQLEDASHNVQEDKDEQW
jgi:hypothetical protein